MIRRPDPRGLARDSRGATILEFALIAPSLCLLLLGSIDIGHRMYMTSVVQGVVFKAARKATVGDITSAQLDTWVTNQLQDFSKNATVKITKKSYADFTGVKQMEAIKQDTAPFGVYNAGTSAANPGDCYEDVNNNWKRDERGKAGLGGSDDIVYYEVSIEYPRIVPMTILGWGNTEIVKSNTVLRNQPYGVQNLASPPVRCYEQ